MGFEPVSLTSFNELPTDPPNGWLRLNRLDRIRRVQATQSSPKNPILSTQPDLFDSPRAIHESQRRQVAPGGGEEGATGPVDVIPVDEGRPEPLDAHGPVVAEHEERQEQEPEHHWHEEPSRSRLQNKGH